MVSLKAKSRKTTGLFSSTKDIEVKRVNPRPTKSHISLWRRPTSLSRGKTRAQHGPGEKLRAFRQALVVEKTVLLSYYLSLLIALSVHLSVLVYRSKNLWFVHLKKNTKKLYLYLPYLWKSGAGSSSQKNNAIASLSTKFKVLNKLYSVKTRITTYKNSIIHSIPPFKFPHFQLSPLSFKKKKTQQKH